MKNFQQTPKQGSLVLAGNKAAHTLARKPGRTYNEPWEENKRIGLEPIFRLARFDHTRHYSWFY